MILSFLRTGFFYILLLAVIRLMGKRQIGQMAPAEFVVTMLCANLASIPIQDGGIPLLSGLVPILTVLALELILSGLSLRSIFLRRMLCGNPVILIDDGKIIQNNLRITRITLDELLCLLRAKNILDPEWVQFAILETDGSLTVFPYPRHAPASAEDAGLSPPSQQLPLLLISDGRLLEENLLASGRSRAWLKGLLRSRGCTAGQVWMLLYWDENRVTLCRKELSP